MNLLDRWFCVIGVALLYVDWIGGWWFRPHWFGGLVVLWGIIGIMELEWDRYCQRRDRRRSRSD